MKNIFIFFFSLSVAASYSNTEPVPRKTISFTENKGQVSDQFYKPRPDVLFSGSANGMVYHLKNNGISYQLYKIDYSKKSGAISSSKRMSQTEEKASSKTTIYRLDINWLNANENPITQKGKTVLGYDNYYLEVCPEGATKVKSYEDITYKNIYTGIDLHYYNKDGNLKYDYIIQPNTDYKQIQLQINGAKKISVNKKGQLVIKTPLGEVIEGTPIAFQNNRQLKGKWKVKERNVSFEIENVNPALPLIIDPLISVRAWGTYYGASGSESGNACSIDTAGYVFMTGGTDATTGTIIATVGSHQSVIGGNDDAYIVKFDASGIRQWGTYYGSLSGEIANSCATDSAGNIYITGTTNSASSTVIATIGSHQSTLWWRCNGCLFG